MKKTCCTCKLCRLSIRLAITYAFEAHPRWWGEWFIRFHSDLGWVPLPFYREILDEMVRLGQLIMLAPPDRPYPVYILARLTLPTPARKGDGS